TGGIQAYLRKGGLGDRHAGACRTRRVGAGIVWLDAVELRGAPAIPDRFPLCRPDRRDDRDVPGGPAGHAPDARVALLTSGHTAKFASHLGGSTLRMSPGRISGVPCPSSRSTRSSSERATTA